MKTLFPYLFIVFLLFQFIPASPVYGQWVKTQGPPGINVNVFFNNGAALFAGTSSKGVFRSSNNGATWTAANSGLENATVLSFTKDNTYIYAGTDKGVFRSSNNGASWIAANTGIETQIVTNMVIGGGYLFAGTSGLGVYRSPDQGGTWQNANGNALNFSQIFAMVYVNNVLIVEADNYLFKTQDAGDTWFVDQGNTAFYVIKHFLVIGDTLLASARNGIFRSFNGGNTWTKFKPILTDEYTELLGFSFSNGIVYTGDKRGMLRSADTGKTWSPIAATGLRFGTRFNNHFVQSGNFFLIGMDEIGVFRSADTGRVWKQSIAGFPVGSNIDNALLNVHDTIVSGTHSDGVYGTPNHGNVWKKIGTKNNNDTLSNAVVYSLFNPAPGILLAGTCGDGLYRSVNNGKTWKHITAGLPYKLFDNYECDFGLTKSGPNILLATTNGIYYSSNNGQSWNASNLNGDRIAIFAIAANGNIAVAGVSQGVFPFQSGIYRSTNNGVTWTLAQATLDVISMAGNGGTIFYAGTFFDNWRSINNGVSWTQMINGLPADKGGYAIKTVGTNNVFLGNDQGVFFSNNQGASFTSVSTGLDPSPNNSVLGIEANGTYLFAGLFKNGVWRRPLSDFGISTNEFNISSDAQNAVTINKKNKLSISPNPARNQTIIDFSTTVTGKVQFKITDQMGKTVMHADEFLTAGDYRKTIDAKQFAPGVYIVQIILNQKIISAKLIVMR